MTYQSSVMLERLFFRAFFATLAARGRRFIDWRDDDTDARFRCAYEFLRSQANTGESVALLVDRLRPDPISGASPAFDTNLMHLQPGFVSAPNPEYEGVRLAGTPADLKRILFSLPKDLRPVVSGAAEAFIQKSSKSRSKRA